MSNRTVIIWLGVALLLGALAFIVLSSGGGSSDSARLVLEPGDRVFSVVPSQVVTMTVKNPAETGVGATQTLRRDASTGEWNITMGEPSPGSTLVSWPIASRRVDAVLTGIAAELCVAKPESSVSLGEKPLVITLGLSTGQSITARFAERALAGSILVEIDPIAGAAPKTEGGAQSPDTPGRRALVNSQLADVFRSSGVGGGPRSWRDATLLAGVGQEVSRLRLVSSAQTLALARVGTTWTITEPAKAAGAPASAEAVAALMGGITSGRIVDFLDESAPAFGSSTAELTIETDRREPLPEGAPADAAPKITTDKRRLELGGPCGSGGTQGERIMARIDGSRIVCIDGRPFAELTLDPIAYLSRRVAEVDPGDIGMVALEPIATPSSPTAGEIVKRQLDTWVVIARDGKETVLADAGALPINAMLAFLTAPPKSDVGLSISLEPPVGYEPSGRISMFSLSQRPLADLEVGIIPPPANEPRAGGTVVVRSSGVYRRYPFDRVPERLTLLTRRAKPAPEVVKPGDKPKDPDK